MDRNTVNSQKTHHVPSPLVSGLCLCWRQRNVYVHSYVNLTGLACENKEDVRMGWGNEKLISAQLFTRFIQAIHASSLILLKYVKPAKITSTRT